MLAIWTLTANHQKSERRFLVVFGAQKIKMGPSDQFVN